MRTAHETAAQLTSQLEYLATTAAPDLSSTKVDTNDRTAVRRAIAYYLGTDRDLNTMFESVVGNWPIIYDAAIVDSDGNAILHTNPELVGKLVPDRPIFNWCRMPAFAGSSAWSITHPPFMTCACPCS